jgi:cytoskeletal protein RodZ
MSLLCIALLAFGFLLWLTAVYVPVVREGRTLPHRSGRDYAEPLPVPVRRPRARRPSEEVNPPATLRTL